MPAISSPTNVRAFQKVVTGDTRLDRIQDNIAVILGELARATRRQTLYGTLAQRPPATAEPANTYYFATDTGAFYVSNGVTWIGVAPAVNPSPSSTASQTSSNSTGWVTKLDWDLTAEANQTLTTDGSYTTTKGITIKKENSAHDRVALAFVNGTGLVYKPDAVGTLDAATRTIPLIRFPLTAISGVTWDWRTQIRVLVDEVDGGAAANDYAIFGIDSDSTGWVLSMWRGHAAGPVPAVAIKFIAGSTTWNTPIKQIGATDATTETVLLETLEMLAPFIQGMTGTSYYSAGAWPAYASLQPWVFNVANETGNLMSNVGTPPAPGALGIFLGAAGVGADTPTFTYKRLRVDVR